MIDAACFRSSTPVRAFALLLFVFSLMSPHTALPQQSVPERASMIVEACAQLHIQPRPTDSTFSVDVFHNLVDLLDPERVFFTRLDIDSLQLHSYAIAAEISSGNDFFLKLIAPIYENRLKQAESYLKSIRQTPFDFAQPDSIVFDSLFYTFTDSLGLQKKWRQSLKLDALLSFTGNEDSTSVQTSQEEELRNAHSDAVERFDCFISSILHQKKFDEYLGNQYLKAIAASFDPHTNYFSQEDLDYFESSLSSESLSFGFDINRNSKGELEVMNLVPGGPAWSSNLIQEGDIIISIQSSHFKIDNTSCLQFAEIAELIYTDKYLEANFIFKKKNGQEFSIKLEKDKVSVEQNVIRTYLLEGEKKIGYIYLPSFYANMDGMDVITEGCAMDIAQAIVDFKDKGVDALVLDIRNNGGGSMLEAVRLAGCFIHMGVVGIAQSKEFGLQAMKDPIRGSLFEAPVVVLVNRYSASASEFFAAAMQDYDRAVIMGDTTFGKSSSQVVVPLLKTYDDRTLSRNNLNSAKNGYLKITTGRFFRVTGDSFQNSGIVPDICLPDLISLSDKGEKQLPCSLANTSVDDGFVFIPYSAPNIHLLNSQSMKRLENDSAFVLIHKEIERQLSQYERFVVPLQMDAFQKYYIEWDKKQFDFETASGNTLNLYEIQDLRAKQSLSKDVLEEEFLKHLRTDPYIRESYQVLLDLIQIEP